MKMPEYFVTWEIEITAKSKRAAARKALKIQRDSESMATVFRVRLDDEADDYVEIDARSIR